MSFLQRLGGAVLVGALCLAAAAACASGDSAGPVTSPSVDATPTMSGEGGEPIDPALARTARVAESLVGLSEAAATAKAEQQDYRVRVVERDGRPFPMTMDYRPDRINLVVTDGVVIRATVG